MLHWTRQRLRRAAVRSAAVLALALAALLPAAPAHAQWTGPGMGPAFYLPTGFVPETVITGLKLPTGFAFGPDGLIYIAEKEGLVRVARDGVLLEEPFIDLRNEVNDIADRGLTSIALHPQFPRQPYVYLAYVYDPPEAKGLPPTGARLSRVLRLTADAANPAAHVAGSGVVILGSNSTFAAIGNPEKGDTKPYSCLDANGAPLRDCLPVEGTGHSVDYLRFAADGSLLVSNGDGINYNVVNLRAQNPDSLAGKILRINPMTGQGYADNPFSDGDLDSNRSKVYALGMRNPFRFAVHPRTGELYVGDVGNNAWEEINVGGAGSNFGWPCFEGPQKGNDEQFCTAVVNGEAPHTSALWAYPHEEGMGSVIAGDFYFGSGWPEAFQGKFFWADFNNGTMRYLKQNPDGTTGDAIFASNVPGPVQIQAGPNGDLYVLAIAAGSLVRIRYVGGDNTPPLAVAAAEPQAGLPPLAVRFTGDKSVDPDGEPISFHWDFGDGQSSDEANPEHTYEAEGVYQAVLTVTDGRGATSSAELAVSAGEGLPSAEIVAPAEGNRYRMGERVRYSGRAADADGNALPASALAWEAVLIHKEHTHYDQHRSTGAAGSLLYEDHGDASFLRLCLTATDAAGRQAQDCVDLLPQEVTITFQSEPSGLPLLYDGTEYTTPFKVVTYVGAKRAVSASATAGEGLSFSSWSDRGAADHMITVGRADSTLTARYVGADGKPVAGAVAGGASDAADAPVVNAVERAGGAAATETAPAGVPAAVPAAPAIPAASGGGILREVWNEVTGKTVADLRSHPAYPDSPDVSEVIPLFDVGSALGNDYGERLRGYIIPPVSGDYRFWIASDDQGELWISPDADPAKAYMIANVVEWSPARNFDHHPAQASGFIMLEAGKRYYIEAIHKEGDQKDNLSVAWQIPGQERAVIAGQYLAPFAAP